MINLLAENYKTVRGHRVPQEAVFSGVNIETEKVSYVDTVGFGDRYEYITKVELFCTFRANSLQKAEFEKNALLNLQRELYADSLPKLHYIAQNISCGDERGALDMLRDLILTLETRGV